MRHIASSSSSFLFRNSSSQSLSLSRYLSSYFVGGRTFDHCVKASISFRTIPATFVPCDFSFTGALIASNYALSTYISVLQALSPAASRGLLPPGFRASIPLSVFPLITFLCHGLLQNRRCLLNAGQSCRCLSRACASCVAPFVTNPNGQLMADRDDVAPTIVFAAKRRMLRRLRSHWRHEQFSIRMALASAVHHSHIRGQTWLHRPILCLPRLAPRPSPAVINAATPAPLPVIEHVVSTSVATHAAPAPVFDFMAPAPVIEHIAPAPAVTCTAPSLQLPPTYTMINFDITGLVYQQFPHCCCGGFCATVAGSLPPLE